MAIFKFIGEAQANWAATSGNIYLAVDGLIEIPTEAGSDLAEARGCGLFAEDTNLGGRADASIGGEA